MNIQLFDIDRLKKNIEKILKDSDIPRGRSVAGNIAGITGTLGGTYLSSRLPGIVRPTSYNIYFSGSAPVSQSW